MLRAIIFSCILSAFCVIQVRSQTVTFGPEIGAAMVMSELRVETDGNGIFQHVSVDPGVHVFIGAFAYYEFAAQLYLEGSARIGQEGRSLSYKDQDEILPSRLRDFQLLLGRKFGRIEIGAGVNYLSGRLIDTIDRGDNFEDSEFMEINRFIETDLSITLNAPEMRNESIRLALSSSFDLSWGSINIRYLYEVSGNSYLQFDEGNDYAVYDHSALAASLRVKLNK